MSKKLKQLVLMPLLVCAVAVTSLADHTRRWRQSTYEEFLKGTPKGVAVRSDGHLELAPKFTLMADADASYLWSLRTDPAGNLYAAGGSPAKVFRLDGGAKPKTVFESTDLLAQCIAFDAKGTLYVGTSPDGKVYKVSTTGEKTVFFEPKTKYIWDLAFGADGTLYVATGDKGQIYAVSPDGKSEMYYASDEAHIKVLDFDAKGNLLAGTEPNGRVLRISRAGDKNVSKHAERGTAEGFVIYETAKQEVTSLAVATDGTTYVSAIGEKIRTTTVGPSTIITTPQGTTTISTNVMPQGATIAAPFVAFPQAISSSIYRISKEGAPEEIWTSRDEVVYSLGLNSDGRLLAGTGNNGALLIIDGRGVYAQLAKSGSSQITGISRASGGKVYLCTANPGKVFSLGPEFEPEGTFESQSFDAKLYSQWGRIDWWGAPAAPDRNNANNKGPRLEFFVRTGNTEDPGREWSKWFGPYTSPDTPVEGPAARFLQWKAVIHDGRPGDGIDWVSVAYLPKNVAPVIDGIAMQDPGVRVQAPVGAVSQPANVTLKQPPAPNPAATPGVVITSSTSTKFEIQPQGTAQRGYQSVLWSAHDDNDDDLKYAVYFRAENQKEWLLLKDNLDQRFYSWDTTAMPDGAYYLKIVASDAPSNPPELTLTTERESERFEVDNTPPVIGKIEAKRSAEQSQGASYDFQFAASDPGSSIEKAQYSVDGGDWILVAPEGGISDAKTETFSFTVRKLSAGEHTVAVRAYDRFDNVGAGKTTFQVAGR